MRCLLVVVTAWLVGGCCTAGPGRSEPLPRSAFDEKVAELSEERGELRRYYRAFRDGDDDGVATLERVLGEPLERIEPQWRRFVLALSLPRRVPEAHARSSEKATHALDAGSQ